MCVQLPKNQQTPTPPPLHRLGPPTTRPTCNPRSLRPPTQQHPSPRALAAPPAQPENENDGLSQLSYDASSVGSAVVRSALHEHTR